MVDTIDSVTAAQWAWRADDGWVEYDDGPNLLIENEFLNGTKRIKVDTERFVDVSMTPAQIKKNFYCVDCESKDLVGIQRRYDDEMKRRAVRRVVPAIFKGMNFVVALDDDELSEKVQRAITAYKGGLKPQITKRPKIKYVISNSDSYVANQELWEEAEELGIPIMTVEFIIDAIKNEEVNEEEDEEFVAKKPESKKRKAPENDDEKKVGDAMDEDVKQEEELVVPPPAKKAKNAEPVPSAPALAAPNASLKPKARFMGVCQANDKIRYPLTMTVTSVDGNAIEGTIDWPTLNNAKTKFRGTASAPSFVFEEYEAIRGEEDVELPAQYNGKFDTDYTISGKVNPDDAETCGTFKIKLVDPDDEDEEEEEAATEDSPLKVGATYKGVSIAEFPFTMTVDNRTRTGEVTGTIHWTSMKCTTKFSGKIEADKFTFTETEVLKTEGEDEADTPMHYTASFQSDGEVGKVSGAYGADVKAPTGKFHINFV